jgi:TatD DNase family protein
MIDSHCHLYTDELAGDLAAVLARAREAGVSGMICVGAGNDLTAARASVALATTEPDVYATVGIHPHDAATISPADWLELERLAGEARVVGIGESGLDYHYQHSPRELQQVAYRRFIALARASARPIVSHVRDAHADAAEILRQEGADQVGGVIHCFTGDVADARRYLELGQYLSFSGILTFKNAEAIRRAAAFAPADRLLVETDAPFLAPIPFRGRRNEPAYVARTLETLAGLRGISPTEADRLTTENARRLFSRLG